MKCPKCGCECNDGVRFCTECGTNLTVDAAGGANDAEVRTENIKPRSDSGAARPVGASRAVVRPGGESKEPKRSGRAALFGIGIKNISSS